MAFLFSSGGYLLDGLLIQFAQIKFFKKFKVQFPTFYELSQEIEFTTIIDDEIKQIIDISLEQMNQFAGNMLLLQNKDSKNFLAMSKSAHNSLKEDQIRVLETFATLTAFDGAQNQTTVKDFYGACETQTRETPFVFQKDEPPVLLGQDAGANPVEYLFAALAGCVTTGLVYHAAAKGIELDEVESTYEGDLDLRGFLGMTNEVRNGYESITITFKIKSDAPREQLEELVQIAQDRSPVFDIVSNPVPINVKLA